MNRRKSEHHKQLLDKRNGMYDTLDKNLGLTEIKKEDKSVKQKKGQREQPELCKMCIYRIYVCWTGNAYYKGNMCTMHKPDETERKRLEILAEQIQMNKGKC